MLLRRVLLFGLVGVIASPFSPDFVLRGKEESFYLAPPSFLSNARLDFSHPLAETLLALNFKNLIIQEQALRVHLGFKNLFGAEIPILQEDLIKLIQLFDSILKKSQNKLAKERALLEAVKYIYWSKLQGENEKKLFLALLQKTGFSGLTAESLAFDETLLTKKEGYQIVYPPISLAMWEEKILTGIDQRILSEELLPEEKTILTDFLSYKESQNSSQRDKILKLEALKAFFLIARAVGLNEFQEQLLIEIIQVGQRWLESGNSRMTEKFFPWLLEEKFFVHFKKWDIFSFLDSIFPDSPEEVTRDLSPLTRGCLLKILCYLGRLHETLFYGNQLDMDYFGILFLARHELKSGNKRQAKLLAHQVYQRFKEALGESNPSWNWMSEGNLAMLGNEGEASHESHGSIKKMKPEMCSALLLAAELFFLLGEQEKAKELCGKVELLAFSNAPVVDRGWALFFLAYSYSEWGDNVNVEKCCDFLFQFCKFESDGLPVPKDDSILDSAAVLMAQGFIVRDQWEKAIAWTQRIGDSKWDDFFSRTVEMFLQAEAIDDALDFAKKAWGEEIPPAALEKILVAKAKQGKLEPFLLIKLLNNSTDQDPILTAVSQCKVRLARDHVLAQIQNLLCKVPPLPCETSL